MVFIEGNSNLVEEQETQAKKGAPLHWACVATAVEFQ